MMIGHTPVLAAYGNADTLSFSGQRTLDPSQTGVADCVGLNLTQKYRESVSWFALGALN
jgi:hypothetical protein